MLIVDENESVRRALVERLSLIPQIEIMGSTGSVEAMFEAVNHDCPDVILVEPKRLNGGGLALLQSLCSRPDPPRIIILTSYSDENEMLVAEELGIECYLLKDINTQFLVESILSCRSPDAD